MSVSIRSATGEDLDLMMAIESDVFGDTAWSRDQLADELARMSESRWYAIADVAGGLAGYAGLYLSLPDADVQTVAVASAQQGAGVGGALLDALVGHAWDIGCTRIFLEVHAENDAALRLYASRGFLRMGSRPHYYADGGDAVTMRLRRWELPGLAEVAHAEQG